MALPDGLYDQLLTEELWQSLFATLERMRDMIRLRCSTVHISTIKASFDQC